MSQSKHQYNVYGYSLISPPHTDFEIVRLYLKSHNSKATQFQDHMSVRFQVRLG